MMMVSTDPSVETTVTVPDKHHRSHCTSILTGSLLLRSRRGEAHVSPLHMGAIELEELGFLTLTSIIIIN
jgi:hypothetical protein